MKVWARQLCLFLALAGAASAQMKMTSQQLVSFIRSSIELRQDDRKVAAYVKKITLTDKLDDRTVESLQGAGAGPQTVLALKSLATNSASLPTTPPPPPKPAYVGPPPPDSIEQKRVLEKITENALAYTDNLPNFLCMQVTRRYVDQSGMDNFRLIDTIAERLSFNDKREDYKVISVNGIPATGREHHQLGGATSSGEFGTILHEIFDPVTQTHFEWERWATLRGRRMHVFSFVVAQPNSKYSIYAESVKQTIIAGYRGLIYADRDSLNVMRITFETTDIPPDFPVQSVKLDLNYDYSDIAGQSFLLPLKAELRSREGKYLVKNEVEFRRYNKFGAESAIQFGDDVPESLPENTTKEQEVR